MSAEIWAIGGGKGGSGKSLLSSGLATYLADMGKKVTLIDADLGGANLHSVLKINRPTHTLTDFFEKKISLEDIIVDTGIPNLRLVIGDIRTLTPDTVSYAHRIKLYRHIKSISGDYVLIDLGAGSSLATLDTFLLADKMIAVTLPEITSIDNLYHFMKKLLFRKLNVFLAQHDLKDAAKKAWRNRRETEIKTIKHLVNHFRNISGDVSAQLDNEFSHFNIHVVINQVRHMPHVQVGSSVKSVIIKYFGIHSQYAGSLNYHDTVWQWVNEAEPFFRTPAGAPMMLEICDIAENILQNHTAAWVDLPEEVRQ